MDYILEIDRLECRYDDEIVIRDLSLRVRENTIACLLGPSGCGKTTVLKAVAGFIPVTGGEIRLRGKTVSRPGMSLPPEKRRVGMVFQDYALFPHMPVIDNVTFGLRGYSRNKRRDTARRMLQTVGLAGYDQRYPHELSGGQQQRVALARALAPRPDCILLDEPLSSLDVELRERLGTEVRDILKDQGISALMVTHDQSEAFAMGDQVGVMRDGHILQWDTPYTIYHEPADRFVADFIGQGRLLRGRLHEKDAIETDAGMIRGNRAFVWPLGSEVDVLLRPDDVVPDPDSALRGTVTHKAFKGAEIMYRVRLGNGCELLSLFPSHLNYQVGDQVGVRIEAEHVVAFPR
jgi:iron(III) transport system ATP-binding protein